MALFSKRFSDQPGLQYDELPDKLRRQILIILDEQRFHRPSYARQIVDHLRKEHGWHDLDKPAQEDPYAFLLGMVRDSKDVPLVLDVIQMLFHAALDGSLTVPQAKMQPVNDLNRFFLESGVGYQFDTSRMEIVPVTNPVLHTEAVQPVLQLLVDTKFVTVNREFTAAFESFKRRDYGNCLKECCCALESTLKIILTEKNWPFDPHATAKPLLDIYMQNTGLPPFWEQPIIVLATLRNRYGAHGGGTTPHDVPQHLARYAIHATGAAILMLVDTAK